MIRLQSFAQSLFLVCGICTAQEMHEHGIPEQLGKVSFPISCAPAVQGDFNRAVALLHSFAFAPAREAFAGVASRDPQCGMAHWGEAMAYFHPVWSPALPPETFADGQKEMLEATRLGAHSDRERQFIHALSLLYQSPASIPTPQRTLAYEQAMAQVARENTRDVESQVFYAVALLSNAPPADKSHARQKQAIAILEPLDRQYPDHPGIAHYMIHACDSQELAPRGLPAARAYAKIAPSSPHALHMPSHIFTRLGLWEDSVRSNLAAWQSAKQHGDQLGELHAMDYLVYAYLQLGEYEDAEKIAGQLNSIPTLDMSNFGVAYAVTAIPIRNAVERGKWADAAAIPPSEGAPASVQAFAMWSAGLGLARTGHPEQARTHATQLRNVAAQLRATGEEYWATQTEVLAEEVTAWSAQAGADTEGALKLLRAAADQEDSLEKRPVTPGPIVPAREQLGYLLLEQKRPDLAQVEFRTALLEAPGRRGALQGLAEASQPRAQMSTR